MYQSLYRTWRPHTFSDMVGQDAIVRTLRNQVVSGHIAHAYLFCGSRGTGKTSAARIMSMAINCQNPNHGDPCLACESCVTLQNDASLDVFEMDAASNSRVEEIRDMLEKVNYPPQQVKHKVYIIDEVHMLSNAAFNALLKTLEEPPEYMVFILATTEPQKLPATILSRCQRFDFGRISEDAIISRLNKALEGEKAESGALALIASSAEGSMRDAWSLMDMCLEKGKELTEERMRDALGAVNREFLFDFLQLLSRRDAKAALDMVSALLADGRDAQVFLRDLSRHIRQVIAVMLQATPSGDATKEHVQRLKQQGASLQLSFLTYLMDLCMRTEADARWASSQRTVLEVFALRACLLDDARDSLALQARVDALEERLSAVKAGHVAPASAPAPAPAPVMVQAERPAPVEKVPEAKTAVPPKNEEPVPEEPAPPVQSRDAEPDNKPAEQTAPPDEAALEEPAPSVPLPDKAAKAALPKDAWNRMLERVKREHTSYYGIIQQGKFGGFKEERFFLSFEKQHGFYLSFLNDAARKGDIEKILTEEMGRLVTFEAILQDNQAQQISREQIAAQDIDLLSHLAGRENIIVQDE